MFINIVITLIIVSILWALWSLKDARKDTKAIKGVRKQLESGRVIFRNDHTATESSSSSSEI